MSGFVGRGGPSWWRESTPIQRFCITLLLIQSVIIFLVIGVVVYAKTDSNNKIGDVARSQIANREVGYQNRAVQCRIVLKMKLTLGLPCLDPEVTKYYDPTNAENVVQAPTTTIGR